MKKKLTLSIEIELLQAARELGAQRGTSVQRLLVCALEQSVRRPQEYERCRRAALALLEHGLSLGGEPLSRAATHERRGR